MVDCCEFSRLFNRPFTTLYWPERLVTGDADLDGYLKVSAHRK